jgi:hypothetical protein
LLSCFPFGVIVLFYRVSCLVSFYCNPCYTGLLPTLVAPPVYAQEQRTDADYSLTPNITPKKAQDIIEKAQRMLDFAQENVETA